MSKQSISKIVEKIETEQVEDRTQVLNGFIQDVIRGVLDLGSDDAIDVDMPLKDVGLDSITAVAVKNEIQVHIPSLSDLQATDMFDHPTVSLLSEYILNLLDIEFLPTAAESTKLPNTDGLTLEKVKDEVKSLEKDDLMKRLKDELGGGDD